MNCLFRCFGKVGLHEQLLVYNPMQNNTELTNIVIIIRYVLFCVVFTYSMSCRSPGWFLHDTFTFKLDRSSLGFGLHVFQFVKYHIIISKSSKELEIFIIIWFSLASTWLGLVGDGFVLVILKYQKKILKRGVYITVNLRIRVLYEGLYQIKYDP